MCTVSYDPYDVLAESVIDPVSTPGYVYIVQMEGHPTYKIGRTVNVPKRMSDFGILLPFPFRLLLAWRVPDAKWGEYLLHQQFRELRTNGEWFRLGPEELAAAKAQILYLQSMWLIQRVVQRLHDDSFLNGRNGAPFLRRYARLIFRLNARDDRRLTTLAGCAPVEPVEPPMFVSEAVS